MATNIQSQSQTELKAHLEERLRAQFPSSGRQEIVNAVEIALGHQGYILEHDNQQHRDNGQRDQQRDQQQGNQQRDQQSNNQQRNNQQQNNQQQNNQQHDQRDNARRDNGQQGQGNHQMHPSYAAVMAVRDAAISAANSISDQAVKMAAIAGAEAAMCATSVVLEQNQQNQQKASRN